MYEYRYYFLWAAKPHGRLCCYESLPDEFVTLNFLCDMKHRTDLRGERFRLLLRNILVH